MSMSVFNFDNQSRANVLVVDDDPTIVRLVERYLEAEFGCAIVRHHATSGQQAQEVVERNLIDLVITDLEMAKVNGFQLLNWLKEWEPLIQVIVITGHRTHDALRSAFSLGANDFLVKPIEAQPLVRSVEFLLGRMQRWQALLGQSTPDGPLFGVSPSCRS